MGADCRVLVTRPATQSASLVAALESQAFSVARLPLLAIEAFDPLPGPERQRVMDLDRYQHLVFISANAARIGLDCIHDFWPQLPVGQRYWAVGVSTATVLEEAGMVVERPEKDMSSEGLLALPGLAAVDQQRVLIVRGVGGRQLIATTLEERGARVDSLCCYRRRPVDYDGAQLRRDLAASPVHLILVSSGEGLGLLSGLLQPQEHTNLARTTLLVPSPRVAKDAEAQGWQQVITVDNASDEAMLAAAQAWRDAHPGRDGFE